MNEVEQLKKKNRELQMQISNLEEELKKMTLSRNVAIILMLFCAIAGYIG